MTNIPEKERLFVAALLNQRDDSHKRSAELEVENNKLRGLLAQGKGDCVYCGLPAAEISKCPHGFPGCARMDDIVNAPETKLEVENAALVIRVVTLENVIRELLKGGEHEGECDNDQVMMNEGGACQKHCDTNDAREDAARKLLEATDGPKG
jgi:hypothetical protein